MTPPKVSIPNVNGVTSNSKTSSISPARIAPCIAAPIETTKSGSIDLSGSLPVISLTAFWTAGIRVDPPTNNILFKLFILISASSIALRIGPIVAWTKSAVKSSNLARVKSMFKCLGPVWSAVTYGILIFAFWTVDNSIFACSAASFNLCIAVLSFVKSTPCSFLNSEANQSTIASSKSFPPSLLLPEVAWTSTIPSSISNTDTSKVPPPKSKTSIVSASDLSKPYARAAAVGSATILSTSKPAILPASLVAFLWLSEK